MVILTSNGLSSQQLIDETKKYIKNDMKTAAMITTASEYKEKDHNVPRLTSELEALGLLVEYFDIDNKPAALLINYDVILILGGNPFYLLKRFREENCKQIFEEIKDHKLIIGISAGTFVLQDSINLVAQYSPEMNQGINLTDLKGLGLVNIEVLPHYSRYLSRFERFEERAQEYELAYRCKIVRLNDGQGIFVFDDNVYVV